MLTGLGRNMLSRNLGRSIINRSKNVSPAAAVVSGSHQVRNYRHWWNCPPDDFGLPKHSMPADMEEIMKNPDVRELDYIENYW